MTGMEADDKRQSQVALSLSQQGAENARVLSPCLPKKNGNEMQQDFSIIIISIKATSKFTSKPEHQQTTTN